MKLPARSLACCALFLVVFSLLLRVPFLSGGYRAQQSQWDTNQVRCERLQLLKEFPQVVFVGSSMTARLDFSEGAVGHPYVLAFSGDGPRTGLALLARSQRVPRWVVVEVNLLVKRPDEALIFQATQPLLVGARKKVEALRTESKPIPLICSKACRAVQYVKGWLGQGAESTSQNDARSEASLPHGESTDTLAEPLERAMKDFEIAPEGGQLEEALSSLAKEVALLEAKGVRIAFLEMPVNSQLENLPRLRVIREAVQRAYDSAKYPYLRPGLRHPYRTTDGIHLGGAERSECSALVEAWSSQLLGD